MGSLRKIFLFIFHLIYINNRCFFFLSHSLTKTHIACALSITAMRQNHTVKYIRANTLLKESEHARQNGTYFESSNERAAYDLMVIDDYDLMDLDIDKCRDLFEIIEFRDCRKI